MLSEPTLDQDVGLVQSADSKQVIIIISVVLNVKR